jgi:16S rRNA (cytosine967-C5)-methyltransferase
VGARAVALEALDRIDGGAYANLAVPGLLERSRLSGRDRDLVTELVYGTTRMRRACDWLVDAHLQRDVEPSVRNVLRLGAYQLAFMATPPHAAVGETVGITPLRARGLVNAVLRRVAEHLPPTWPDDATRLSYPDWIVERLVADLGAAQALAAMEAMNQPAVVTRRPDGYVQDLASQWVGELLGTKPGDVVADLCAAPGGKATAIAEAGAALVVATDVRASRASLVAANALDLRLAQVATVVADGRQPPIVPASADRVLVDAPCSGLGVLRRRPDARWRVTEDDVVDLARLQRELLDAAASLVRPGGVVVYSACTMTTAETVDIDAWLGEAHPELEPLPAPGAPWEPLGRGARVLPQTAGTDGMYVLLTRRT